MLRNKEEFISNLKHVYTHTAHARNGGTFEHMYIQDLYYVFENYDVVVDNQVQSNKGYKLYTYYENADSGVQDMTVVYQIGNIKFNLFHWRANDRFDDKCDLIGLFESVEDAISIVWNNIDPLLKFKIKVTETLVYED